ncbi:uncharacterized protein LOC143178107 isoform X2 [Calliopsis andreniformis]
MQNIVQLKLDDADLNNQISKLEDEYEQLDYIVREKAQKLKNTQSKRSKIKARTDLLKMKYDQTATQLRDCNDMGLVCQHLMPSTCKYLDPDMLQEMLTVVTSLWTGANKRQVWDTLMTNLDDIEVPTLWNHIYQNMKNFDELMKSETTHSLDTDKKNVNVGIAKLYAQHISMVLKRLVHSAAANNYQKSILEFIQKIEIASNNSTDVSEWLALALGVRRLESEQKHLQKEIDKIREDLYENNTLTLDIAQLASEIQNIDTEIKTYIQDIQLSLSLLKSMPTFIVKTKEKIYAELQKIKAIRYDNYDTTWLKHDLTTELEIFHDTLDINALRKIILKGDVGIYRHTKCCFSEASVSVTNFQSTNIMSYYPMVQTPIYSLIECYKNLVLTFLYKRFESLDVEERNTFQMPMLTYKEDTSNIIDLLNLSKAINLKTNTEIEEFNEILNAWVHQTVQKVMEIIEKSVDDTTFPDWIKRYTLMLYTLKNSK